MASTRPSSASSEPAGAPDPGALGVLWIEEDPVHGEVIRGSREVGPLLGLRPGELPQDAATLLEFVVAGDRIAVADALARTDAGPSDVVCRVGGPDGATRVLELSGRRLGDGRQLIVLRPNTPGEGGPALFRRLADTVPVLIWVADPWGGFLFVNEAWSSFTGRAGEDLLGEGWLELVHPGDRDAVASARAAAVERHERFDARFRLLRADGTFRWVTDRGLPYTAADGTHAGWVGGVVDVHEREVELTRAAVLAEAGEALEATLDEDHLLRGVVAVCADRLGSWARIEFGSRVAAAAGDPGGADPPGDLRVPLLAGGGRVLGTLVVGPAASVLDEELVHEIGRRTGLALQHVRLFGEARRQQRASEEARALLDALVTGAPVGFAQFDAQLRYVRVNTALAEINGVPPEGHAGRTVGELLPEMDPAVEADLRRVLETGEPLVDVPVVGATPRAPGRQRHYVASYYRVTLPDGETLGLGATVLEVTARLEAERALRAQRDLYEALLRAQSEAGEAFLLLEGERLLYVNEATERIVARNAEELYELGSVLDVVVEADRGVLASYLQDVRAGEVLAGGVEVGLVTPAGVVVDAEVAARAMADGRTVVLGRDVSERKRADAERERLLAAERLARQETERARGRAAFLAEVSGAMERSLSMEDTLGEVVRLLARDVCDMTSVWVPDREGYQARRYAVAVRDQPRLEAANALRDTAVPLSSAHPACEVLRTGRRLTVTSLSSSEVVGFAGSEAEVRQVEALAPRSFLALPLVARGRTVGALLMAWDVEAGWPTDEEAMAQLDEVARRVALFVDNAVLYAERAHVASTLQASLLPPELPVVEGLDVAARYLPAGEAAEVGGDFYDVFPCGGEGSWALVVGDVCGKGTEAAAVTAMARYTLRAALTGDADERRRLPSTAFDVLNQTMLAEAVPDRFLTAVMGCLSPAAGSGGSADRSGGSDAPEASLRLALALAGHPAPVLLRGGQAPVALTAAGPLLGVRREATWVDADVFLRPGDALVLYTDGVTEADRRAPLEAEELAGLLVDAPIDDADALADYVRRLAERRAGGRLRDDVAIVTLRVR